jgi:hypothetical protein
MVATTARSELNKNQIFGQVHHLKETHNQSINHNCLEEQPIMSSQEMPADTYNLYVTVTKWRLCVILTTTRLLKGPLVKFTVGGDGSEVWVSEPMLRTKSTYFDKALGGTTTEKRKAVMLEKESLGPFMCWVQILYTDTFVAPTFANPHDVIGQVLPVLAVARRFGAYETTSWDCRAKMEAMFQSDRDIFNREVIEEVFGEPREGAVMYPSDDPVKVMCANLCVKSWVESQPHGRKPRKLCRWESEMNAIPELKMMVEVAGAECLSTEKKGLFKDPFNEQYFSC